MLLLSWHPSLASRFNSQLWDADCRHTFYRRRTAWAWVALLLGRTHGTHSTHMAHTGTHMARTWHARHTHGTHMAHARHTHGTHGARSAQVGAEASAPGVERWRGGASAAPGALAAAAAAARVLASAVAAAGAAAGAAARTPGRGRGATGAGTASCAGRVGAAWCWGTGASPAARESEGMQPFVPHLMDSVVVRMVCAV